MIIYKTTNRINGKIYIGQSIINDPKYLGSGVAFTRSIKKYGKENFSKEILRFCKSQKELDIWESIHIRKFKATDTSIGYNILPGPAMGVLSKNGINPSLIPEIRERATASLNKYYETHDGSLKGRFGELHPGYGHKRTKEAKERVSNTHKDKYKNGYKNPNTGISPSEETRRKRSEAVRMSYVNNPELRKLRSLQSKKNERENI